MTAAPLAAFAADPAAPSDARALAARSLAKLDGHRAPGLRLLAALANDPRAEKRHRASAATSLTVLDLSRVRR
ncbi:hypothetical protein AB0B30_34870 [Streptomyces narbonensis]|uniref:Uncharacterized protein n=1 Tax=Streptomyces narbonensis TaxID=67333 RepID=A0ABV3CDI8_9ACTN